jgi:hypothetical protein
LYYIDKKLLKTDPSHAAHYIYPNQTICITRVFVNENNDSVKVYGAAMDSCWMFKTIKGRINAYSYLSEVGQDFDVYTIVGIQLGFDNPVQNFNDRNLQKMIADDRKAMKLLDDDDSNLITYLSLPVLSKPRYYSCYYNHLPSKRNLLISRL